MATEVLSATRDRFSLADWEIGGGPRDSDVLLRSYYLANPIQGLDKVTAGRVFALDIGKTRALHQALGALLNGG